jgi:hypothetical protein
VVGTAATPDGRGYWLVAADGGVFAYGSAGFLGSAVGLAGSGTVVDLEPTPGGTGYWMADSNGGVFAFGDAAFFGSAAGMDLTGPVVGVVSSPATVPVPQDFTIAGDAPIALLPGTTSSIDLRFANPNAVAITVKSVTVTVTTSGVTCAASAFALVRGLHGPVAVPARTTATLSQLGVPPADWPSLGMLDTGTDQDGCQHAQLTLHYQGEATG